MGSEMCIRDSCFSVYEALSAEDTRTPSEASLVLILHGVKELMRLHVVKFLTWVNTSDMLSDGLTKGGVSRKALFEFCQSGRWTLKHDCKTFSEKLRTGLSAAHVTFPP